MRTKFIAAVMTLTCAISAFAENQVAVGDLKYTIANNEAEVCGAVDSQSLTNAIIPAEITVDGTTYRVTSIGDEAFISCDNLMYVNIDKYVSHIGYDVFAPGSIIGIQVDDDNKWFASIQTALYNKECSTLLIYPSGRGGHFEIPRDVTSIGPGAFAGCRVSTVYIPESVHEIGQGAFWKCTNIEYMTIPKSIKSIGRNAFAGCTKLRSLLVESENEYYTSIDGDGVLYNKDVTTLVAYPAGKTATSYAIPSTVTVIESSAFTECAALNSVEIPNSVTYIGEFAFSGCRNLSSVNIPEHLAVIHTGTFQGCSFSAIEIPNGVKVIGDWAFNSNKLKSLTLPSSLTIIGEYAFNQSRELQTLVIPESIVSIGDQAFTTSYNIASVTYNTANPIEASENIFDTKVYSQATLKTLDPEKARTIKPWSLFTTIEAGIDNIEATPQGSEAVYDLQGRRVLAPRPGHIYIINGQKLLK